MSVSTMLNNVPYQTIKQKVFIFLISDAKSKKKKIFYYQKPFCQPQSLVFSLFLCSCFSSVLCQFLPLSASSYCFPITVLFDNNNNTQYVCLLTNLVEKSHWKQGWEDSMPAMMCRFAAIYRLLGNHIHDQKATTTKHPTIFRGKFV